MNFHLKLVACFLLITKIPQFLSCDFEEIDESFEQINGIISRIETSGILSSQLNYEEFLFKCDFFTEMLQIKFDSFKESFRKCLEAQSEIKFIQKNLNLLRLVCSFDDQYRKELFNQSYSSKFLSCDKILTESCGNDSKKDYCNPHNRNEFLSCMDFKVSGSCQHYGEFYQYINKILDYWEQRSLCGDQHIINS